LIIGLLGVQIAEVNRARAFQVEVDASIDPEAQARSQIETVMDQQRMVFVALTADRLSELGNAAPIIGRLAHAHDPVLGRRARAADEAEATLMSLLAQAATRGFEAPIINTGFSLDMLDAMPEFVGGEQWMCLTEALYFEARGESLLGQFAVAEVILNRVESKRYPSSICGVVRQGIGRLNSCQFSFLCDGLAEQVHEPVAFARAGRIAAMMIEGRPRRLTFGATHYHTLAVSPRWASRLHQTAQIGEHVFYRQVTELALN